jgi:hypothetical protein
MSSSVLFRFHHSKQNESVTFIGNGIRLLDLKKEIFERKKMSSSLDFDLKITDETSGKGS